MFRAVIAGGILISVLFLPADALAQGCSMCGTAVQDAQDPLARGLNASILFMASMPFLLFFSVAGYVVYHYRRWGPSDTENSR